MQRHRRSTTPAADREATLAQPRPPGQTSNLRRCTGSSARHQPFGQSPERRLQLGRPEDREGDVESGQVARYPVHLVGTDAKEHALRALLDGAQGCRNPTPRLAQAGLEQYLGFPGPGQGGHHLLDVAGRTMAEGISAREHANPLRRGDRDPSPPRGDRRVSAAAGPLEGIPRLSRRSLRSVGAAPPPGIVHLGLGNFARAHTAVYTAAALAESSGPWGIVGVAQRSHAVADALLAQDLLYSVLTLAPDGVQTAIPAVLAGVVVAADQPEALLEHLAEPTTRIVTLTVTEKGYSYSPAGLGLDLDDPLVRADIGGGPPRTAVGQVVRGIQGRAAGHGEPVAVVSCDNLVANGDRTRRLVQEFVAALPAAEREDVSAFLAAAVSFPSTMVDRIVPATTPEHRRLAAERLRAIDEVPVPTEPFSMWVLEDDFAGGRPAWEAGGAIFTDDVHAYELLKLRLLNGTHSLIAYLGMLAGQRYIADAVQVSPIEKAARALIDRDYLPTLKVPAGIDGPRYVEQLFDRFANTAIAHPTTQVGSDGSLKLPVRVTEAALEHLDSGRVPRMLALTVAAYIACLALPDDYDGAALGELHDPAAGRLADLGARHSDPRRLVPAVFREAGIFSPELARREAFTDCVAGLLGTLTRHGVDAAVEDALAG